MSNFNGLVRAKKEDLDKAVSNWDKAYGNAVGIRRELLERSKQETVTTKFLWLFSNTQTKYEYIKSELGFDGSYWTISCGLRDLYPEEFTGHIFWIWENRNYFADIKAMLSINPDELYLSSEQAAKVVKWRDYDQT